MVLLCRNMCARCTGTTTARLAQGCLQVLLCVLQRLLGVTDDQLRLRA